MAIQLKREANLAEIIKAIAMDMAAKDKKHLIPRFRQAPSKWKLEFYLVDAMMDQAFSKSSEIYEDLRPIIKREFGSMRLTGR